MNPIHYKTFIFMLTTWDEHMDIVRWVRENCENSSTLYNTKYKATIVKTFGKSNIVKMSLVYGDYESPRYMALLNEPDKYLITHREIDYDKEKLYDIYGRG